jgi:MFS family permease
MNQYFLKNRPAAVAIFAAVVSFAAYTCIFSFRKAFNVASFSGYSLFGLDYKIVLVITQVAGYMLSKFYGIKFISELKRYGRGKLILILVGISWMAWLGFALVPAPYNFWCLFFNGFPLGMIWGIVFSYIEGRRTTDFISAALAVSFIFASGFAKSVAQWLMNSWQVTEYWMPFWVGVVFMLPLLLFVFLLEKIPHPDAEDVLLRVERTPMTATERKNMLGNFLPGIVMLVFIYIFVTILREVRDSFMADMWRESGEVFAASVFAKTETIISIIILIMIGSMMLLKNNFHAFMLTQIIMLTGFVIVGVCTVLYIQKDLSSFYWMTAVGLGLYMVYIPYNSILFERFIATFRFAGNVGFLIYIADSFGYLGSVLVLLSKSVFNVQMQWLQFYTNLALFMSVVGVTGCSICLYYFYRKKKTLFGLSTVNV